MSRLLKRSMSLSGHRTSIALEPDFWDTLAAAARRDGQTLAALVAAIDAARAPDEPLASALRLFALRSLRAEPDGPPAP